MDNKYCTLHETPIRAAIDIYDTIKAMDGKDILDKANRSPYASTSIARIASNMTLVFPMLCSTNLHIDTAMMIMKALERKYTVMLQILFSAYQVTDVKSAQDFISRFHSNIKLSNKASVDDFIDLADTFAESGKMTVSKTELDKLSKDFRENCFFVLDNDIAPTSIAENYSIFNEKQGYRGSRNRRQQQFDSDKSKLNKAQRDSIYQRSNYDRRADERNTEKHGWDRKEHDAKMNQYRNKDQIDRFNIDNMQGDHDRQAAKDYISMAKSAMDAQRAAELHPGEIEGQGLKNAKTRLDIERLERERDTYNVGQMKDMSNYFANQILDNDIKKANELVPTTMVVNFKYVDPDSGRATPLDNIVLGIKCRFIPVDSKDIIDHLLTKLNDKNFITQLIRATTREISFFKDFILAIDNAKIEALANSKRGSANPLWKVLERRAILSRMKRFVGIRGNNANAITALVVSQEEVEYVHKNYGKSFDSMKTINTIIDAYNLIGFVIVDESMETAKFVFDTGEDMMETLSFNSLEREASDTSYKKIVNLLSKVG